MAVQSVSISDIHKGFNRIAELLTKDMRKLDDRTGWYQYIGENKVGDVATAQGILIFNFIGQKPNRLPELVTTLKESQVRKEGNPTDGGWTFLSSRDTPTIEATVWAILGLLASGMSTDGPEIVKGESWLQRNQNPDGGWAAIKGLASRVYITYLACLGLTAIGPASARGNVARFESVLNWIRNAQNPDGGWGEQPGSEESSPVHTAFALLTLQILGVDRTRDYVRKAIKYLYKAWNPVQMWEGTKTLEQYIIPQKGVAQARITINYFPTPWAINALLSMGEDIFRKEIYTSVKWLIRAQNEDGSWTIKNVEGRRLWAIHDATLAISLFLKKILSSETAEKILLYNDFLVICRKQREHAFICATFFLAITTLLCGFLLGVESNSFVLNSHLASWVSQYWAGLILVLYIISIFPLVKIRVLSWKEGLLGIIIPTLLVIFLVYLKL